MRWNLNGGSFRSPESSLGNSVFGTIFEEAGKLGLEEEWLGFLRLIGSLVAEVLMEVELGWFGLGLGLGFGVESMAGWSAPLVGQRASPLVSL